MGQTAVLVHSFLELRIKTLVVLGVREPVGVLFGIASFIELVFLYVLIYVVDF